MSVESGVQDLRAEFVRESTVGQTPADPDWLRYSDVVIGLSSQPNINPFMQRGIGEIDPTAFHRGPEDNELTVTYHLQKWLTESGGTHLDAAADGILRTSTGGFVNTHSILARQALADGGALDGGVRIYTVAKGAYPAQVMIRANPDSGEPAQVEITYNAEKVRSYLIHQPSGATTVDVVSDSANDTTQSVTIENEDAGTTETLALNGTTEVNGATSFSDIDSISLDAECEGTVTVSIGGTTICTIYGSSTYDDIEGDLGVPPLGTGSHEAALGSAFEKIVGDTINRGGSALSANVLALEFSFNNNLEVTPRLDSFRRRINPGVRTLEANATIFATYQSHDDMIEHLRLTESTLSWQMTGGNLELTNAILSTVGPRSYETEQAVMRRDNTFTARGVNVTEA